MAPRSSPSSDPLPTSIARTRCPGGAPAVSTRPRTVGITSPAAAERSTHRPQAPSAAGGAAENQAPSANAAKHRRAASSATVDEHNRHQGQRSRRGDSTRPFGAFRNRRPAESAPPLRQRPTATSTAGGREDQAAAANSGHYGAQCRTVASTGDDASRRPPQNGDGHAISLAVATIDRAMIISELSCNSINSSLQKQKIRRMSPSARILPFAADDGTPSGKFSGQPGVRRARFRSR